MQADDHLTLKWDRENTAWHMQMGIETFSKLQDDRARSMMHSLRAVTREKYDYADSCADSAPWSR